MDAELVELVNSFQSSVAVSNAARKSVDYLKRAGNRNQAHTKLCCAMIQRVDGGNADFDLLLHYAGAIQVLVVTYHYISYAK